ncbi:hypothetical protein C4D60_Mb04t18190 [Musa balbisiana]|uniref:Uncharacterized protein n=1 Tax=Musa balbisiana TaxID=52838 RepID=A0A4S8KCX9_MUSBA|nr:hypothetical protein C4D60_Mb04t18190 [Musa balbisiana]
MESQREVARLRRGGGGRGLKHTEVAGRPQALGRGAGEGGGRVWCRRREERGRRTSTGARKRCRRRRRARLVPKT